MHPNPAFRKASRGANLAFARARGFGLLALSGVNGGPDANPAGGPDANPDHGAKAPLLAHVPFVLSGDGGAAELHLARSNPIARALAEPRPATLAVSGPDGYVSPDWYGLPDQVPTWNYVAVHLVGTLELLPAEALRPHLDRLSAEFERRLAPKPPWTADKMPPEALARLLRMIVPCRLTVASVDATWKLNQNKLDEARLGVAAAIPGSSGQELLALAALTRAGAPEQE